MKNNILIIFEGTDGSGKATQVKMLSDYLTSKKIPHEQIAFPRYDENKYGQWIKKYLIGDFSEVDIKTVALNFANDRKLAKPGIEKWLKDGKIVLADRYVSSSKAHMSVKLTPNEREQFIKWLDDLEYKKNKIPKEDLVIFLYVPAEIAKINIKKRGKIQDLHEEDLEHLKLSNQIYQELAKRERNWLIINCTENGKMRSKLEIHQEIVDKLASII